jgi:hypothetical protein
MWRVWRLRFGCFAVEGGLLVRSGPRGHGLRCQPDHKGIDSAGRDARADGLDIKGQAWVVSGRKTMSAWMRRRPLRGHEAADLCRRGQPGRVRRGDERSGVVALRGVATSGEDAPQRFSSGADFAAGARAGDEHRVGKPGEASGAGGDPGRECNHRWNDGGGSSTADALAVSQSDTNTALVLAGARSGSALETTTQKTGNALTKSYRGVRHALGTAAKRSGGALGVDGREKNAPPPH